VTTEVSVSQRRRSPSARSALPLKASLAQFENLRLLCDELEPEAAVSVRQRDQPRSHAAEVVSRADVLGGQLAEATERPVEVSARAETLAETLVMMARARC
jgi:hypothetical protein